MAPPFSVSSNDVILSCVSNVTYLLCFPHSLVFYLYTCVFSLTDSLCFPHFLVLDLYLCLCIFRRDNTVQHILWNLHSLYIHHCQGSIWKNIPCKKYGLWIVYGVIFILFAHLTSVCFISMWKCVNDTI